MILGFAAPRVRTRDTSIYWRREQVQRARQNLTIAQASYNMYRLGLYRSYDIGDEKSISEQTNHKRGY